MNIYPITTPGGSNGQIQINNSGVFGGITDNSTNWTAAYNWGNHALEGYLKVESDPVFIAWVSMVNRYQMYSYFI
jgi:hypothetical protein